MRVRFYNKNGFHTFESDSIDFNFEETIMKSRDKEIKCLPEDILEIRNDSTLLISFYDASTQKNITGKLITFQTDNCCVDGKTKVRINSLISIIEEKVKI